MKSCLTAMLFVALGTSGALWAAPKTFKPTPKKAMNALVVQGRVKSSTKPPRPGSVPYKDAVIALHLVGVKALQGKAKKEIVVFVWGMRANKWTSAAKYHPGQTVKLRLTAWDKAERKYGRYNRFELGDEATDDLDVFWGE